MAQTTGKSSQSEWADAFRRAFAATGRTPVGRTLFHESREDLAVQLGHLARPSMAHTQVCGLCLDDPASPARLMYLSSADPQDAVRLACGGLPRERELGLGREGEPPESSRATALAVVERLRALAGRAMADEAVVVRWVSSMQRVTIARDDGLVVCDKREGWRLRLDAQPSATVELARGLPPEPDDERLAQLVQSLADTVARRSETIPPPFGPTTVVLAPGAGGVWAHEVFGHALEADTFASGRSWLARIAPGALPDQLTVSDDPLRCRTPISIDDEGTATSPLVLVANGRIMSCLHDRTSATRAGRRPTGHGRRATFRDPVLPRMTCTYVERGPTRADEILADVDDGLYVRRMEAGTIDTSSGRATFRVTDADRIRRGTIEAAVEPHVLEIQAGRGFSGLRVGDDVELDTITGSCHRDGQTLITSVGAPTLCLGMVGVVR